MRNSEDNKGTEAPCENCGGRFYTMGDFTTTCDECSASIADTETGKVYKSDGKVVFSTSGGTCYGGSD